MESFVKETERHQESTQPRLPKKTIKSINPATGELIGEIEVLSHDDVINAVHTARRAFDSWSATSFESRREIILNAVDLMHERIDEIADIITKENGKPRTESLLAEILPALYMTQWVAKNAQRVLADEPINAFIWRMIGKRSYIQYKPKGVVGIISPWNYPWGIPVGQIANALMAGNTVVFKPSSTVPFIGDAIGKVFHDAGVPKDVLIVTQGPGRIGEGMIDGEVDHLIFTGSVEVGRHVNQLAAAKFIPTTMELGGKDPMIVLDDADLDAAAAGAIWGAFANSGQTCASVERVYVMEKVYDEFVEKVIEKTRKLRQGVDTDFNVDVGAMTNPPQIDIVEQHVEDALKKGATIRTGGKRRDDLPGFFYEPTVITEVNESMDCMVEETFGPTLPIRKVVSEDEAIRLSNDSRFGLTASVWSTNISRAERVASQIMTGTVTINDALSTFGMGETPWGGVKESGTGRTHGEFGLHEMVRPLHIAVDSLPKLKKLWWYPYDKKLYDITKNTLSFFTRKAVGKKSKLLFDAARKISLKDKY